MKKALSLALTLCMVLSLFATFVVSASADEVVTWEDGIINDPADTKPEDGQNLKFSNAYGYKFAIDADNKIGGEDNVVIKDQATYEACNPNWAITVQLIPAGDYYVAGLVVPTPGSAAKAIEAGINFDNGNIVLVAHSSYSYDPGEGKGQNYTGKLAALALKEGDKVQVSDTEVYVLIPGVDDKPAAPVKGENIALGKDYTTSEQFRQGGAPDWGYDPNADIAYPDEKGSLTDGKANPADTDSKTCYQDAVWAGFSYLVPSYKEIGYNYVTVDLGATKALYEAAIYFGTSFLGNGIGVSNGEVQFFVSDDNATWTEISEKIAIVDDANATTTKVSAEVSGSGRYVQVRFAREGWLFVSEVEVYEAVGGVQTVKEEITVDGNHNDTGWAKDGWVEVSGDNGFWQNPLPWQVENGVYPDLAYKYQVRADETKLYVAVEVNCALVEGGNGNGTNVRFWLNTNDEATVYTHFYDVFKKDGVVSYNAKYNTSTTANSGANTENSTIVPTITSENGKTYVEFSVDLAEFNGAEGFNYFICVSNKANADANNVCLYYPAMPIGPVTDTHDGPNHIPYQNLPYVTWHRATQATVVVEDILLGEVVVDNGSDEEVKEEADTSMMGDAPAAPKFSATLNGPEAWVAGEKVKIDVVIEVLEDELALNQILFNLFFDAADVEITLPTDDFSALVTAAPADSWKGENAMFALSTVDGYGLISGGVGSENEADSLKKGDKVVVSFEFTAKADAKGLINFQLSNDELAGYTYADPATAIAGAGSNLAIAEKTDDLGDAGIYAIAALAIVALIGTAVVIKKRA